MANTSYFLRGRDRVNAGHWQLFVSGYLDSKPNQYQIRLAHNAYAFHVWFLLHAMRLNNSSGGQTILYKQECDILGFNFPWRSDHCVLNNISVIETLLGLKIAMRNKRKVGKKSK